MSNSNKKRYLDLRKFAANLRQLTETLPTESEKASLRSEFQEVISFMTQAQQALDTLPSIEHTEAVRKAASTFEALEAKVKANPLFAAALGVKLPRAPRPKPAGRTPEESATAEELLRQLRSLPTDDMNKQLGNEALTPSRQLTAIASLLGIKTTRKQGRDALVQQIVTKISNFRGYEELQGRATS